MSVYLKTLCVVICILAFNYALTLHPGIPLSFGLLEVFFNIFGVLYAIIVGFVIYLVLDNYNDIKSYIDSEINEIQDLRDYLIYVDEQEELKKEIKAKIKKYLDFVIHEEWPAMESYKKIDMDTPPIIYEIMVAINKIKVNNPSDQVALEKLIGSVAGITTYRTNRLSASLERLPMLMRHLIAILSAFIVLSFTLIPIENFWVNMGLNAISGFGISLIYFIIEDLDYPFGGVWSIKPEAFEELMKKLD